MVRTLALVGLAALAVGAAACDADDPSPEQIERLVTQLGSEVFLEREDAYRRLQDAAELALPSLRRRINDHDVELRLRAAALVAAIEKGGDLLTCRGHQGEILAVVLLPDDRRAITASTDNTLRRWDLATGSEERRFEGHTQQVWCLALSPDRKHIASGGRDCTVRIWDVETGTGVKVLPRFDDPVRSIAYTPDGQSLLVGCLDGKLRLIALDTGAVRRVLGDQPGGVLSVAIAGDGKRALSGGGFNDRTVRLWDLDSGKELRKLIGHTERVSAVHFLPGERAVSAGQDRTVRVWDLKSGTELCSLTGHTGAIHSLALTRDARHLVTGGGESDWTIRVWDLGTRDELRRFTGHKDAICGLAVTNNGKQIISVSSDRTLRLWNMPRIRRGHEPRP
jgi:WD40 repeat protein